MNVTNVRLFKTGYMRSMSLVGITSVWHGTVKHGIYRATHSIELDLMLLP